MTFTNIIITLPIGCMKLYKVPKSMIWFVCFTKFVEFQMIHIEDTGELPEKLLQRILTHHISSFLSHCVSGRQRTSFVRAV